MYIEFPTFDHAVFFHHKENIEAKPGLPLVQSPKWGLTRPTASAIITSSPFSKDKVKGELELVVVHDSELTRENPVETKYLKLMRYNRYL